MSDTVPLLRARPGDFIVTPTFGNWRGRLEAALIQWGTDSPVNHAALFDGECFIEADPGGARRVGLDKYADKTLVWSTGILDPDPGQRDATCEAAHSFADNKTPYGWLDIVAIALAQHRCFGIVHADWPLEKQPWWVQRIESLDTLICSQLVDVAWEAGGFRLFDDGRIPGLVSPGDLWRRLGSPALGSQNVIAA